LYGGWGFIAARKHKVELVVEKLLDEESLPHATTAIHGYHFGFPFLANRLEKLLFVFSSDDSIASHVGM
jgi:hypothetical protein